MSLRLFLIDGPGAGRSLQDDSAPAQLSWESEGIAHAYRRAVHFASSYFYRYER
jgi:hypothetical protein